MTDSGDRLGSDHRQGESLINAVSASPRETEEFGRCLARVCRPGDLIVLRGDLGAGKTTFTRGLGAGLGVRGPVTSPTFVVARRHPHPDGGTDLVHVDAYRLGSSGEVDDLDLWDSAATAVTVVEWGDGRVEHLSEHRLHIELSEIAEDPQARRIRVRAIGARWSASDVRALAECANVEVTS